MRQESKTTVDGYALQLACVAMQTCRNVDFDYSMHMRNVVLLTHLTPLLVPAAAPCLKDASRDSTLTSLSATKRASEQWNSLEMVLVKRLTTGYTL